jgi:hypothetical protein
MQDAQAALQDFSNGRIQETDLQRRLVNAGIVKHNDVAWILDLDGGRWCMYDGVKIQLEPPGVPGKG